MSLFHDLHTSDFDAAAFEADTRANVLKLVSTLGAASAERLVQRYRRIHGAQVDPLHIYDALYALVAAGALVHSGSVEASSQGDDVPIWALPSKEKR